MPTARIPVQPAVLTWARESAGLDKEAAARRLAVSTDVLERWESGERVPTLVQLRKAAKVYNRPLAALFVPAPLQDPPPPLADFRRLDPDDESGWPPGVRTVIQRAVNQRRTMLELKEVAPDAVPSVDVEFTIRDGEPAEAAGSRLRSLLRLDEIPLAVKRRPSEFLTALVRRLETSGVIVIQTQRIPLKEMKGFSIAERPFPVIALNGSDWPRPKIFTLLHELVHIGLRSSGLCDLHETTGGQARTSSDDVEHYCNQVAASALMPPNELRSWAARVGGGQSDWPLDALNDLADKFGASSEAALLRLVGLRITTWATYWRRKPELTQAYEDAWDAQRQRQQEATGFPSPYVLKARDLGRAYVSSVVEAFEGDAISSRDLAEYLGVRYDQLPKLIQAARI